MRAVRHVSSANWKKKKEQQGQGSLFGSLQARGVHRNPLDIWNWCLELGLIFCFYIHLILFFFAFEFGIDHRLMIRVPSVVIKFSAKPFGIKKGIYLQMLSSTHLIVKTLEKHMDQRKKGVTDYCAGQPSETFGSLQLWYFFSGPVGLRWCTAGNSRKE